MSQEQMNLLSIAFRVFIIASTNTLMAVYVTSRILNKRRSLLGMCAYVIGKVLIQTVLIGVVLDDYYAGNTWFTVLNTTVVCVTAVLSYVMFCWTFEGEFIRIAVVAGLGEIPIAFFGYFSLAVVNFLERRTDIWGVVEVFEPLDLLIPLIDYVIIRLLLYSMGPYLKKLATCRLKYKKLLWTVFITYIACGSISVIKSLADLSRPNRVIILFVISMLLVLIVMFRQYNRSALKERAFLHAKQRLGQTHYETIQWQIRQMEQSQQVIDGQMEQLMQMKEFDSETAASYLEQIKSAHEEIRAGIYCDDWVIDALLYSQEMLLRKKGIRLQCSLQGYTRGQISEADMIQVLTVLLEYAEQAVGKVCEAGKEKILTLEMITIKKQMIIELSVMDKGKDRLLKHKLNPYLKKYDGTLVNSQEGEKVKVVLALKTGI